MGNFLSRIHDYLLWLGPYPWLRAILIIVAFFFLGKAVDWVITGFLSGLVKKTKSKYDDRILQLLHRPIFLTVLLFGLGIATNELDLRERVTIITLHALQTIGTLVWFRFSLKLTKLTLDELEGNETNFRFVTSATKPLLLNSVTLVFVALSVYVIFLIWQINITAWIASAGIIGLAVSFAAKDTLANIFGGITIFADKPFKVGDFINLDSGERGVISQIGVRSTRILTRDDVEITIPNGMLATTKIINESGGPHEKFRIRVKIGVAYGSDIDRVEEVLLKAARDHTEVCQLPTPRVRFRDFGDSSLVYELLCWVEKPVLRGRVLHELHRQVYKAFMAEGIEIPFPQREIVIKRMPGKSPEGK
ncbi:MAG: mechanosensitive ion channel family protein [Pyrinomonadaceae bacterium]